MTTLLAALFLLILALPTLLMGVLRIYENILILDTEHALLVEAVSVGELVRSQLDSGRSVGPLQEPLPGEPRYAAIQPRLDLDQARVLPRAERDGEATRLTGPDPLSDFLQRAQVRNLSGIRVLDTKGFVVASSSREVGYKLGHLDEVKAALAGRYEPVLRRRVSSSPVPVLGSLSRAAKIRVSLAIPIFGSVRGAVDSGENVIAVVYASRTPLELPEALWSWRDKLYAPFLVSMVITLLLGGFLSWTISAPLSRLRAYATEVANGRDATLKVGPIVPQETVALAEAVQRMQNELRERADYIREFAANTAHELKTPLTSLRGAAELLIDDASMPLETRKRFATNIMQDALRMDSLVRRILELARIESSPVQREVIDLNAYFAGLAERYQRQGHTIKVEIEGQVNLHAAADQLETAMTSLLDNAVRHGAGEVVTLRAMRTDEVVQIEVEDRGQKLPANHFEQAFQRFFSTERTRGGTGLGLAMVKAVVQAHDGTVEALVLKRGACLRLRLPQLAQSDTESG